MISRAASFPRVSRRGSGRPRAGLFLTPLALCWLGSSPTTLVGAEHSCGNPSPAQQYLVQLINRARANPSAEAARYGIGLNDGLTPGTITTDPKPPLATHPSLLQSATSHSQWMLDTGIFSHTGINGTTPRQRMEAAGYLGGWAWGENIAWVSDSTDFPAQSYVEEIHRNLFMSATHRKTMLNANYDEVGVATNMGVYEGYYGMMTTEDFSVSTSTPGPLITGVIYHDYDADGLYDIGEGISGVAIAVAGSSYTATTGAAGSYAVPVPGDGTYTVTFQVPNLAPIDRAATVQNSKNVALDLPLAYAPPTLVGPDHPRVDRVSQYDITPVGGATEYRVRHGELGAPPPIEGAENGTTDVIFTQTAGYAVIQNAVRFDGAYAFHLAHPAPESQRIQLRRSVVPGPGATLQFRSRLGYATSSQIANVEVSTDAGNTWQAVWSQAGSNGAGESGFTLRALSLEEFDGREIMVRFSYTFVMGGTYYYQTSDGVGWYIDQITFDLCQEVLAPMIEAVPPATPYVCQPSSTAQRALSVLPIISDGERPPGPARQISPVMNDYAGWKAAYEEAHSLPTGTLDEPLGDLDRDGRSNLIEYAFEDQGANPSIPDAEATADAVVEGTWLLLDYSIDTAKQDLQVEPVASDDLVAWHAPGEAGAPSGFTDIDLGTGDDTIQNRRASVPTTSGTPLFLKLKARIATP